jgi:hypothetical protein
MVLVGSITFSVTNALLADHSGMLSTQGNAFTNSGHHKTANGSNQADKKVKDQTPTTDVKNVQTTLTDNTSAPQVVSKNNNKNEQDIDISQKNTTKISAPSTTANTTAPVTNRAPATITAPATIIAPITNTALAVKTAVTTSTTANSNSTANGASSTKSAAAAVPTPSTAPTTTTTATTNHGQQVSQAAKEKAANRKK